MVTPRRAAEEHGSLHSASGLFIPSPGAATGRFYGVDGWEDVPVAFEGDPDAESFKPYRARRLQLGGTMGNTSSAPFGGSSSGSTTPTVLTTTGTAREKQAHTLMSIVGTGPRRSYYYESNGDPYNMTFGFAFRIVGGVSTNLASDSEAFFGLAGPWEVQYATVTGGAVGFQFRGSSVGSGTSGNWAFAHVDQSGGTWTSVDTGIAATVDEVYCFEVKCEPGSGEVDFRIRCLSNPAGPATHTATSNLPDSENLGDGARLSRAVTARTATTSSATRVFFSSIQGVERGLL